MRSRGNLFGSPGKKWKDSTSPLKIAAFLVVAMTIGNSFRNHGRRQWNSVPTTMCISRCVYTDPTTGRNGHHGSPSRRRRRRRHSLP